jgi:hypothetical protein
MPLPNRFGHLIGQGTPLIAIATLDKKLVKKLHTRNRFLICPSYQEALQWSITHIIVIIIKNAEGGVLENSPLRSVIIVVIVIVIIPPDHGNELK